LPSRAELPRRLFLLLCILNSSSSHTSSFTVPRRPFLRPPRPRNPSKHRRPHGRCGRPVHACGQAAPGSLRPC
jgi:hypothetical protein